MSWQRGFEASLTTPERCSGRSRWSAGRSALASSPISSAGPPSERPRQRAASPTEGWSSNATGGYRSSTTSCGKPPSGDSVPSARRELHRSLSERLERTAGDDVAQLREALDHRRLGGLAARDLAERLLRSPRRRWLGRDGLRDLARIVDDDEVGTPAWAELAVDVASLAVELNDHAFALERWGDLADRSVAASIGGYRGARGGEGRLRAGAGRGRPCMDRTRSGAIRSSGHACPGGRARRRRCSRPDLARTSPGRGRDRRRPGGAGGASAHPRRGRSAASPSRGMAGHA